MTIAFGFQRLGLSLPVTSAKANDPYLASPQKSPNDVQNLPNAHALPLTRVASGSAESTASEKTTFE
jgi:hypothetical protein